MERLDQFMARAVSAYYATRDPYADFTTSPEISQVFGELLGLWAAVTWEALGCPSPVILAEVGPGRGTLMVDALRAISVAAPRFAASVRVHLVERSAALRARQGVVLPQARWHESLEALPPGPLLLLANEFLDALPIRQFVRTEQGWFERWVEGGAFCNVPSDEALPEAKPGCVQERCEGAQAVAAHLAQRFGAAPGAALFLDYGADQGGAGDSLQALRGGQPVSPLTEPGLADVTAHVDFTAFAAAGRRAGGAVYGPISQGVFLTRLGLFQRTERLARGRAAHEVMALVDAARRLAEPSRMGRLFKVLVLCHADLGVPPGFEA
jgi:SAM-dependent MidA family methyltransferase